MELEKKQLQVWRLFAIEARKNICSDEFEGPTRYEVKYRFDWEEYLIPENLVFSCRKDLEYCILNGKI